MASSTTSHSPKVHKRRLKGHRQQVLCISHPGDHAKYSSITDAHLQHHPSLLLSGSEDGTARLWDLRMRKTAYCIVVPTKENESNDVTAVAFHPSIIEDGQSSDESGDAATIFASGQDCMVYVSSATNVYGYDLRHHAKTCPQSPIIKTPHLDLSSSFQCLDEINQLSFPFPKCNKDGRRRNNYQMAAVDDCGEVHIPSECIPQSIKISEQSPISSKHTVLHHAEPGSHTIASSAVFRPRVNGTYVASGGTDCVVKLFDVTKPKRSISTIHIKPAESENTTQICNPPFIHSLQWSPSGRLLAAGVGDGSCVILRGEGNRLVEIGRLGYDQGGHGSAVAAVCFPGFGSSATKLANSIEAEDRLLISAGNDGRILFWDLGGNMVHGDALNPLLYLGGCSNINEQSKKTDDELQDATDAIKSVTISSKKGKKKKKGKSKISTEDALFLDDLLPSPPKVLFQIPHNQKPNWITCSRASDDALPSSVFVADTTNDISIYSLQPTTS